MNEMILRGNKEGSHTGREGEYFFFAPNMSIEMNGLQWHFAKKIYRFGISDELKKNKVRQDPFSARKI